MIFVIVCALGPGLWGLLVQRALARADADKRRFAPGAAPPSDYTI
jgi:hypothetical protein